MNVKFLACEGQNVIWPLLCRWDYPNVDDLRHWYQVCMITMWVSIVHSLTRCNLHLWSHRVEIRP